MKREKSAKTLQFPIALVAFSLILSSCTPIKGNHVTLMLEKGNFTCANYMESKPRGSDFTFSLTLPIDKAIFGSSYPSYSLVEETDTEAKLRYDVITFFDVKYDTVVSLFIDKAMTIDYVDGDTVFSEIINKSHDRINVSNNPPFFSKPGFKLIGYQKGEEILGLGERTSIPEDGKLELTPVYKKESDDSIFQYEPIDSSRIKITSVLSNEKEIVIPESLGGYGVYSLGKGAIKEKELTSLVLPKNLFEIEEGAIKDSIIENLILFDSLEKVSSSSFMGSEVSSIKLNAVSDPAYICTYFGSYPDKYDRLLKLKDKKKIVLYSGSSTRFGFDSRIIDEAFKDYEVINMGVYAYTDSFPQLDVILPFMNEGDIMIVSPEFDTLETQTNVDNNMDYAFFSMVESDYGILSNISPKKYPSFFDAFGTYLKGRRNLERHPYSLSPNLFDENGHRVNSSSYNEYGDYSLFRKNNEERKSFGVRRAYYNKKYFPQEDIALFNDAFLPFKEKGVKLFYDYSPRMETSLSSDSTSDSIKELGE